MTLSKEGRQFVREVLSMYEALQRARSRAPSARWRFRGFDGNNEIAYMAYAEDLVASGQFRDVECEGPTFNSYAPTLDGYAAMLAQWNASADKWRLTAEDAVRITDARLDRH